MGEGEKLTVFVSYSRRDSIEFVDELVAGLELAGFAPILDRHDISAGEDWEARLGGLIRHSDTVVFVISPEAVKSKRCAWEIDKTQTLSKRLLPVVFRPVAEAQIPPQLKRLQFVRFDAGTSFNRPLAKLAVALKQDIDWIREHTRLGELAARWEARGRSESLLLRGDDIKSARDWVAYRKPDAPEITDLQRAFLKSSENTEIADQLRAKRLRVQALRMRVVVGLLLLALLVGLSYAGWSSQEYLKIRVFSLPEIFWPKVLTSVAEKALRPHDGFKECSVCPSMIVIPQGESAP